MPSVRLTALSAPTITKAANTMYSGHGQLNEMPVNGIHSCGRPLDPRNSTSTNTPATRIWSTSFCFGVRPAFSFFLIFA